MYLIIIIVDMWCKSYLSKSYSQLTIKLLQYVCISNVVIAQCIDSIVMM